VFPWRYTTKLIQATNSSKMTDLASVPSTRMTPSKCRATELNGKPSPEPERKLRWVFKNNNEDEL
jgi:hypothetical protein